MEIKRGCVYFFRHVGLNPVKIGYSENESPIDRFNQFKTYAPFGSEILGFIIISNAKELETSLHRKYTSKRLNGEWFDITEEEVNSEVEFHTNISVIKDRNDFQIAWAKEVNRVNEIVFNDIKVGKSDVNKFETFRKIYALDPNLNKSRTAKKLNVSRQTIILWTKKINET